MKERETDYKGDSHRRNVLLSSSSRRRGDERKRSRSRSPLHKPSRQHQPEPVRRDRLAERRESPRRRYCEEESAWRHGQPRRPTGTTDVERRQAPTIETKTTTSTDRINHGQPRRSTGITDNRKRRTTVPSDRSAKTAAVAEHSDSPSCSTRLQDASGDNKSCEPTRKSPSSQQPVKSDAPLSLKASPSSSSPPSPLSTIERLGRLSEKRLRQSNAVKLPTADDFFMAAEKERYFQNMYRLIVTARQEIQTLEEKLRESRKSLDARCAVTCPLCAHKFSTEPNRLLPRYLKVLRSTNRVEIQFSDMARLKEWLMLNQLDKDAEGVPTYFEREAAPAAEKLRLADVKSTLCTTSDAADKNNNNHRKP